jgi:hypothetical protein
MSANISHQNTYCDYSMRESSRKYSYGLRFQANGRDRKYHLATSIRK